jgi:hypothetical protein
MPETTAASTSPADSALYTEELLLRRRSIAGEYGRILNLLEDDLLKERPDLLRAHLILERQIFKRLSSCQRTIAALYPDGAPGLPMLKELAMGARKLHGLFASGSANLQERLKKSSLRNRPKRSFDGDASFIDLSC